MISNLVEDKIKYIYCNASKTFESQVKYIESLLNEGYSFEFVDK